MPEKKGKLKVPVRPNSNPDKVKPQRACFEKGDFHCITGCPHSTSETRRAQVDACRTLLPPVRTMVTVVVFDREGDTTVDVRIAKTNTD